MKNYGSTLHLQDVGRQIWDSRPITLSDLQHGLQADEILVALYDQFIVKAAVMIESEADIEYLQNAYSTGQLSRLYYYAAPKFNVFQVHMSPNNSGRDLPLKEKTDVSSNTSTNWDRPEYPTTE